MTTLNGNTLMELSHANTTSYSITKRLADRQRLRKITDISRLKNDLIKAGERIVDTEYTAYWKELQSQGIGNVIYGRNGKPNRFEWHYSLKNVAKSALEGENIEAKELKQSASVKVKRGRGRPKGFSPKKKNIESITNVTESVTPTFVSTQATKSASDKLVFVPCANGLHIEIKMPHNVTALELDMVMQALKQLKDSGAL